MLEVDKLVGAPIRPVMLIVKLKSPYLINKVLFANKAKNVLIINIQYYDSGKDIDAACNFLNQYDLKFTTNARPSQTVGLGRSTCSY